MWVFMGGFMDDWKRTIVVSSMVCSLYDRADAT